MVVAGWTLSSWVELWVGSKDAHTGGISLRAWPDGQCLLDQPKVVVVMFELIKERALWAMNKDP